MYVIYLEHSSKSEHRRSRSRSPRPRSDRSESHRRHDSPDKYATSKRKSGMLCLFKLLFTLF